MPSNQADGATRETALVTGATSGIGWQLAKRLALGGRAVIATGRDAGKLAELGREARGAEIVPIQADLGGSGGVESLLDAVGRSGRSVDILVNNAGFGDHGPFAESDLARQMSMIEVNINALVRLTRHFLPPMIARRRGRIMNVASTAGFVPGPFMPIYYATKAFVLSFSQALSSELEGTGVTVSALCPGATRTNFDVVAHTSETRLFGRRVMSAEAVADAALRGLLAGKRLIVPGFSNKAAVALLRLSPRSAALRLVRSLNSKR